MRRPLALCVALLALPLASYAGLGDVGAHRMFTRPEQVRLRVLAYERDGLPVVIPPLRLAPHLSRDARRVITPLGDYTTVETARTLLAGALDDLGTLACALHPAAVRVEVRLDRRTLEGAALGSELYQAPCR